MRKLIIEEWITLDGFAEDANGKLDFMMSPELNESSDMDQLEKMKDIDLIILGANTYAFFAEFWPGAKANEEMIADRLNATPKLVFSKTLREAPWGKWDPATVYAGNAIEKVADLKRTEGKNMILWGSISLAQSLMKAGLADELHIRICPSVAGKGRALFPAGTGLSDLKLLESKAYGSDLVYLRYAV